MTTKNSKTILREILQHMGQMSHITFRDEKGKPQTIHGIMSMSVELRRELIADGWAALETNIE